MLTGDFTVDAAKQCGEAVTECLIRAARLDVFSLVAEMAKVHGVTGTDFSAALLAMWKVEAEANAKAIERLAALDGP